MANCDICSAEISLDQGIAVSTERLRAMVSRGFGPPEQVIALAKAAGLTEEQMLDRWKRGLLQSEKSTWLLCPACAGRAVDYEPRPMTPHRRTSPPASTPAFRPSAPRPAARPVTSSWANEAVEPPPASHSPPVVLLVLGVVVLVFVSLGAWYLTHPAPPAPVASGTGSLPTKPLPTRPTDPPTATPVPDLSEALLRLEDLPVGFQALTDQEKTEGGLTDEELLNFWGANYTEAELINPTMYWFLYPGKFEFVASYLLYPLTPREQELFDRDVASGALLQFFSTKFGPGGSNPAGRLSDIDNFGDCSIGMTISDQDSEHPLRVNTAMVRRGPVLEVLYIMYEDGRYPPMGLYMLTLLLDKRVAAGLE